MVSIEAMKDSNWDLQIQVFRRRLNPEVIEARNEIFLSLPSDHGLITLVINKDKPFQISVLLEKNQEFMQTAMNKYVETAFQNQKTTLTSLFNYLLQNWKSFETCNTKERELMVQQVDSKKPETPTDLEPLANKLEGPLSERVHLNTTLDYEVLRGQNHCQKQNTTQTKTTISGSEQLFNDEKPKKIIYSKGGNDGKEDDLQNVNEPQDAYSNDHDIQSKDTELLGNEYCLEWKNPHLTNVGTLKAPILRLVIKCVRCHYGSEISIATKFSLVCNKCSNTLRLVWVPGVIHPNNARLGILHTLGCVPVDVMPIDCQVSCMECVDEQITSFKGISSMQPMLQFCKVCKNRILVEHQDTEFHLLKQRQSSMGGKVSAKKKQKQNLNITKGLPLPNNGACEHYKKSFRWFRFSCCDRVYPCDECHDADQNHTFEHANRIICGYCAMESFYKKDATCPHCGNMTVKKQTSAYWEGGKGMRDRVRMSRKDPRKYKRKHHGN
ncbi:zf-CHY type zinc finger protein [Schizosaccharomyces pombe]|uniref:Uncharacterized protein C18H10.09 n=1 Tax=Schizosaccharomyces pombe (strain 972 / ATCC 24843) TaxID=284812 RepID=YNS9_SCHPO|nr:zf-CHY type zinc finger protein [Schizosaccharomyces pombe]O60140.2 RecName: Full=Uncharacterized protein C18H10.09 [Schizosaccharomyces pombe 972h-]CAA18406.2 zf-CHY type zinc finger protein [Schizosaccharomyces pombe]|eukprot:NP_595733.2 zf-CHY type zinc finger protein [Schizosaccharomyces pombe]